MRVLVTGGAGFLGSHLVELLLHYGHDVSVVDNLSTGRVENVPPDVRLMVRDIRDSLDEVFVESRPDVVIHLAAQVSVPNSVSNPADDASVNVLGHINVLRTSARFNVKKVVFISSAAVYGNPRSLPLNETAPLQPLCPYGLSKLTGEMYTRLLCQQYNMTYTILRPANIYGPRQQSHADGAVVPSFLERFFNRIDPTIHGDGSQTRDFIYVKDMATAIAASLTEGDYLTLNIGTGKPVSIIEVWKTLARLVDWGRDPVYGPSRKGDVRHSVMDCQLAHRALRWSPTVSLHDGLVATVAWWKANLSKDRI